MTYAKTVPWEWGPNGAVETEQQLRLAGHSTPEPPISAPAMHPKFRQNCRVSRLIFVGNLKNNLFFMFTLLTV
jgi:hypothetical protein